MATTVTGVVVDERGAPVADAEVEAALRVWGSPPRRARTDAEGRFAFAGLRDCQSYVLRGSHRGFAPEALEVTPCGTATGYRLMLHPGTAAFGTVVDENGRPVGGARVELLGNDVYPHPYRSVSRPDGSFRISGLPAAVFVLRVTHQGFPLLVRTEIDTRKTEPVDLGRLALPAGKRFRGKALDPQGHPLTGARVFAVSMNDPALRWGANSDPGLEPEAVADPDGRFEVARIVPVTFLYVCIPGYEPSRTVLGFPSTDPPAEPRRIVLAPAPPRPRISGRVLDEAGQPVAGARVSFGDPKAFWTEHARDGWEPCHEAARREETTGSTGRFALDLAGSGEAEIWARAPGYLREIRKVARGQTAGIDIVLHRGATVAGRVFAPDGSPAAGARVYATQDGGAAETVTDAQGRYRLAAVEPGWRDLWADRPDLGEARRRLELAPGTQRLDLTLDGRKEPAIAGRVVGPDGEPLAGVFVQKDLSSGLETGEDGAFRIVLPRGHLLFEGETENLMLSREGYATRLYSFQPSTLPLEGLEIRLEKSRDLTGRVLGIEPEQLARVDIEASRKDDARPGRVEPDGTYRISDLGSGAWSVRARLGDRVAQGVVELGSEGARLDLELPPLTEVRGTVLAPDGSAVSGASVRFNDPALGASSGSQTRSQEDGSFSIELPAGRYAVSAVAETYDLTSLEAPLVVGDGPVDGLEVRLKPGIVLRGRILGMPEGASSSMELSRGDVDLWADVQPDGTYRARGLEPGEWRVDVTLDQGEIHRAREIRMTVAPGVPEAVFDVDLSLGDLTLAGRLASGEEPLSATVTLLLPDGTTLANDVMAEDSNGGAFRFPGLSAGRYLLRIQDYYRDRRVDVPVHLTSDREMTVDLLRGD